MKIDLDAIRARAAHVVAGPWMAGEPKCVDDVDAWEIPIHLPSVVDGKPDERSMFALVRYQTAGFQYPHAESMADAEFIAHAREDIPALLALVDSLVKKLADADLVIVSMRSAIDEADADEFDAVYTPARPIDADAPTQVIRLDGSWPA